MLVEEAIALLEEAELKQLAIKNDKTAVIGYINLGILELHKRFNIWQEEALVTMVEGTNKYALDGVDVNVTIDLSDHDILMIEEVYGPDGVKIPLNDEDDPNGIWTPRYHTIELLAPITSGDCSVIYRATPKFLTNEKQPIGIPPQMVEALFNYVGYRGHGSVKGDIKSENNTHYMRFEESCKRIAEEGLIAADDVQSHKFTDRGFV